jgi:hypothetical protein
MLMRLFAIFSLSLVTQNISNYGSLATEAKTELSVGQFGPARGGQFAPARPGQFRPAKPGQFEPAKGGQLHRIFQDKLYFRRILDLPSSNCKMDLPT